MTANQTTKNNKTSFPYEEYKHTYQILGGITFACIGLWLGSVLFGSEQALLNGNALAYWTNVSTEVLGVIVTIVVINQFAIAREQNKLKKRLVRQAGSPSQAISTEAIAQLREEGWLVGKNGLLKGADLTGANLSGANLSEANLEGAKLFKANLHQAILEHANLKSCDLFETNLSDARLYRANFDDARLENADLSHSIPWESSFQNANLSEANFREANMPQSNLTGANIQKTCFKGANLKGTKLKDVSLFSTDFEGATLLNAQIQPARVGQVYGMPENLYYFTILPDGRAVVFTDDLEDFLTDGDNIASIPDLTRTFTWYHGVDWEMFTSSQHPDYKNWKWDWLGKNKKETK